MKESKRISRQLVLQTLYEADFHGDISEANLLPTSSRISDEFYTGKGITDTQQLYAVFLLQKVALMQIVIDSYIEHNATAHSIKKISLIDRNILRLSLAEIFFGIDYGVSHEFAIKEAISLGDMFSDERSVGFIAGLLKGSLKLKPKERDVREKEKMEKISALVYTVENGVYYYLLVIDHFKKWRIVRTQNESLPEINEATMLKVMELIFGLECAVEDAKIAKYSYKVYIPEEGQMKRNSVVMLLKADKKDPIEINDEYGVVQEARWFTVEEIRKLSMYSDLKRIILDYIEKQQ